MKDLGDVEWCLGMKVTRDRENQYLFLSQETYIGKILRAFRMDNEMVKAVPTPGSTSIRQTKADCGDPDKKEK